MVSENINCEFCHATNCFIQKYLNPTSLSKVNQQKHIIHFKQEQYIFYETNFVNGIYFIKNGKAKIFFTRKKEDQIIRLAGSGDILGHRGLSSYSNYYPISSIALIDSAICFIPKALLTEILQINPSLSYQFTLFYADELMQSEKRWHSLSRISLRERVVNAILMTLNSFYETINEGELHDLFLTRKEIGDIASTSPEQVSREFTWLKEQGIIAIVGRKKIIINDYDKLTSLLKNSKLT